MATRLKHTYRVMLRDDGIGEARRVEFEAFDPTLALHLAQREKPGREVMLFEDERPIGTLTYGRGGFWTVGTAPRRPNDDGKSKRGGSPAR